MSEDQKAFLVGCDCEELCLEAGKCECQTESGLKSSNGHRTFAYARKVRAYELISYLDNVAHIIIKQKLFNFNLPPGMEVIECNEVRAGRPLPAQWPGFLIFVELHLRSCVPQPGCAAP